MSAGPIFIIYLIIIVIFIVWVLYFSYNEAVERSFYMKTTEEHLRSISKSLRHMAKDEI